MSPSWKRTFDKNSEGKLQLDSHQIVPNFGLSLFSIAARMWRRLEEREPWTQFAISSTRSSSQTTPSSAPFPPKEVSVHTHTINHVSVKQARSGLESSSTVDILWMKNSPNVPCRVEWKSLTASYRDHDVVSLICQGCANPRANEIFDVTIYSNTVHSVRWKGVSSWIIVTTFRTLRSLKQNLCAGTSLELYLRQ